MNDHCFFKVNLQKTKKIKKAQKKIKERVTLTNQRQKNNKIEIENNI